MTGKSPRRLRSVPRPSNEGGVDDLLLATARGDQSALAQVYDKLAPAVFGLARRVVRDPARAEEITQDVFLSVWRLATRFDPEKGSGRTWIMTITHRRAVDVIRSDEAARRREQQASTADVSYDSVTEQTVSHIREQQVRDCLESLTELQRESVVLAYYGGYTYPEVSTLLKVNPSTIKTRMRDGLARLRDCLGGAR